MSDNVINITTVHLTRREPGDTIGDLIVRPGRNGGWVWGTVAWMRGEELMVDCWERVKEYE